jgi:fused signal recognition particle receptor
MFGILRKKLKESMEALTRKAEKPDEGKKEKAEQVKEKAPAAERKREKAKPDSHIHTYITSATPVAPLVRQEKGGIFGFTKKVTEKEFSGKEIDDFFSDMETGLLQANLAIGVIDALRDGMKKRLVGKPVPRMDAGRIIKESFREILLETLRKGDSADADIEAVIKKARKEGRPATVLFLGFNGSGKTTTIAKIARLLMDKGYKPVLAAADTFRAASIEQLEVHGDKLGLKVVKHNYGSDPAAVIFDAKKHAESKGLDVVLADSAGRMHTNANLMDELKKVVRVNKPDLKILVVDSLTGNDVVAQAESFSAGVGIDGIVMTKMDVNEKGGSIISACHASGKPVLYIGTGQEYKDLQKFEPEKFIDGLLG